MTDLVLDNEAVQALIDASHPKHALVTSHLAAIVTEGKRGRPAGVVVPTSVRVEAGWDRTNPASAAINRFRVADHPLDSRAANEATVIRTQARVSVVDAHVGVAVRHLGERAGNHITVLTSDPDDMRRAAGTASVTVVRI